MLVGLVMLLQVSALQVSALQIGTAARIRAPSAVALRFDCCPSMTVNFKEVCTSLQKGEADPKALIECIASASVARGFFDEYLACEEYTCADNAEPPKPLAESLVRASEKVIEVLLMHVVTSAATSIAEEREAGSEQAVESERKGARARVLINALWSESAELRLSCEALKDSVQANDAHYGAQRDGSLEVLRDT